MKLKPNHVLILIFLLVLIFRLILEFKTAYFNSDSSYFHIHLIQNIIETKTPVIYDSLSYSGRTLIYPQLFHYVLAIFSFIPLYLKIIPSLMISSLVIIVYLISKEITKNETASLLTALLSAYIPILIKTTLNEVSVFSLSLPLIFLMYYCLIKIENKKYLKIFIVSSFLLPFVHLNSFLFTFSLAFYFILLNTEGIKVSRLKKETVFFSFFLILLINFIMFKNAFLEYGFNVVWQNTPSLLLSQYFQQFSIFESIFLVGLLPLFFGVIGIVLGMFKKKNDAVTLLTSLILTTLLLLLLRLVDLSSGLLFLGIGLTIISSLTISYILKYVHLTRFFRLSKHLTTLIVILIFLLAIIPSLFVVPTRPLLKNEIEDFKFLEKSSKEDSIILANVEEGNLIKAVAKRKNVIDSNFLLAPNVNQRLKDVNSIYLTWSESKALELLKEYNVDYIYLSNKTKQIYGINKMPYLKNERCFSEQRETIYRVYC